MATPTRRERARPVRAARAFRGPLRGWLRGWLPLNPYAEDRLARIMRRWLNTPYRPNCRVRNGGVDCRHLVAAILDEWSGADEPTVLPYVPVDAGIHDPRAGARAAMAIRRRYPAKVVRDGTFEPGDTLVTASERQGSRIGHAYMVTTEPGWAIHAMPGRTESGGGVRRVDIGSAIGRGVIVQYRWLNKEEWV